MARPIRPPWFHPVFPSFAYTTRFLRKVISFALNKPNVTNELPPQAWFQYIKLGGYLVFRPLTFSYMTQGFLGTELCSYS